MRYLFLCRAYTAAVQKAAFGKAASKHLIINKIRTSKKVSIMRLPDADFYNYDMPPCDGHVTSLYSHTS